MLIQLCYAVYLFWPFARRPAEASEPGLEVGAARVQQQRHVNAARHGQPTAQTCLAGVPVRTAQRKRLAGAHGHAPQRVQGHAVELRIWLKTLDVPEADVVGMTYWEHLTRDHSFDPSRIEGLEIDEQAKLHAAAHYGY